MADLKVDGNHDVLFDDALNDVVVATGWEADKQRLATETIAMFYDLVGSADRENVLQQTEIVIGRVVNDVDGIPAVADYRAYFDQNDSNTVRAEMHFVSGEGFDFPITKGEKDG